jgi:hypothetical protein
VRRAAAIVVLSVTAAACQGSGGRTLTTYYDPQGLFRTQLPAANTITVAPPSSTPASSGPALLSGVVAEPPQPSPSPSTALPASSLLAAQPSADQTIYEAFVYTTTSFADLDQMTLFFLTADPAVDVKQEQPISVAGQRGRLVVADITRDGSLAASLSVALTLGNGETGYIVAAVFPPGSWGAERQDFLNVLASFDPVVPPTMQTYPLQPQAG